MMDPEPRRGPTYAERYEVDLRLARMGLTRQFLAECARRGDIERQSVPPYCYDGHPEYVAGSTIRSAMCELGGQTEGGWHAGTLHRIQVAYNHNESIAIHPTAGTEGTGRPDGDPHNKSLKGPWSGRAASPTPPIIGVEDQLVDFYWFFTLKDDDGLWAELYEPVIDDVGRCLGYDQRIILGKIDDGGDPMRVREPGGLAPPSAPANIRIERTG